MSADIFTFEAGRVYLVQYPYTHLFIVYGPIIEHQPKNWENYFAKKKQALFLKEAEFIQGPSRGTKYYGIGAVDPEDPKEKYISLKFMHPEEPTKTLEWSGFINHPREPEAALRAACSIFRPLEYHDRYKNFHKKDDE